jgi:hypothetical protein
VSALDDGAQLCWYYATEHHLWTSLPLLGIMDKTLTLVINNCGHLISLASLLFSLDQHHGEILYMQDFSKFGFQQIWISANLDFGKFGFQQIWISANLDFGKFGFQQI